MNFLEYAIEVLKEAPVPLTYQEIWEKGMEKKLDSKLNSTGKTPAQTLGARLYVDVRDNKKSELITFGSRPVRFFLKAKESQIPKDLGDSLDTPKKSQTSKTEYKEKEIYPLVTYFVYANPAFTRGKPIWTKTINHEKSKKSSGYSEWNYPDIVGFYLPLDNWDNHIIELNKISDNNVLKLYSFEIKKKIGKSNYKESFFQAVSNSSWAHEGYLVAEVQQDDDLLSELGRLSSSFGIGVIHLDLKDIDSSQILFPARINPLLDWETMSKLSEKNSDFNKFIADVKIDFDAKRIHKEEYNKIIPSPEDYIKEIGCGV